MRSWLSGLANNDAPVARLTRITLWVVGMAALMLVFLSVAGSFSIKLSGLASHKVLAIAVVVVFIFLLLLTTRVFRRRWARLREELIVGAAELGQNETDQGPETIRGWLSETGLELRQHRSGG